MMAFGGAAGLQACKVARQLQVEKVVIPAAAAVLSAHGMLSTDLKYDYSRSHPAALLAMDLDPVKKIVTDMESEGREKLLSQGLSESNIEVSISADMRYLDQIYEVNVQVPDLGQDKESLLHRCAENFHQRYRELYSYSQSEQEIRLVTLRASVVGRLPKMDPPLTTDVGSTVRTATRCPALIALSPSASINVDFPTPGTPVMPIRNDIPTSGNRAVSSDSAWSRWDGRVDSSSVIERASARRSRVRIPSFNSSNSASVIASGPETQ
jgi:hypothetical protein